MKSETVKRLTCLVVCICVFLLPYFMRPYIFSGDEPHYLVAINSVLLDHDLNVANNYSSVSEGSKQTGILYGPKNLIADHHTVFVDKHALPIQWFYNPGPLVSQRYIEVPVHSVVFILLYSLLIIPIVPFLGIERGALFLTNIFSLATILLFYVIAKKYLRYPYAGLAACAVGFGTSIWFYSNTIYSETLITFLVLLGFYLLRQKKYFASGVMCAVASSLKITYVILAVLYGIFLIKEKKIHPFIFFLSGCAVIFAVYFFINYTVYFDPLFFTNFGNPFFPITINYSGNFGRVLYNNLINSNYGLFVFTPLSIFGIFQALISFKKKNQLKILSLIPITIILLFSIWDPEIDPGYFFSYRLILPAVPFLILLAWIYFQDEKRNFLRGIFIIVCFVSVAIQFSSVMVPPKLVTARPPIIMQLLKNVKIAF